MSVRVVCPECGATTNITDGPSRKVVACRQCGHDVAVPSGKPAGPPPLPKKSSTSDDTPADLGFELIDDGDDGPKTDSRPPVGRERDDDSGWVAGAPRRPSVRDDEEEDDDRPRRVRDDNEDDGPRRSRDDEVEDEDDGSSPSRPAIKTAAREDDEEESDPLLRRAARLAQLAEEGESRSRQDDDDERPRRRGPARGRSKTPLVVAGLLAFLMLGAGGGAAAYFLWPKDETTVSKNDNSPRDATPPIDPGPIDPKPVDPKPVDPKPVDPKPKDPVDPKKVDPKPGKVKPADPKKVDPKPADPKVPVVVNKPKLVQPAPAGEPIRPAEMATAHVEVDLPGPIRDSCVARGGRYLVFHCPTARKLVVFDTSTLKIVKNLSVGSDEVLFAAGMQKLLVVYPTEKLVVRYDLATFAPDTDAPLTAGQKPTAAAMGSATAGPLVLGGIPAQGDASKMSLQFLDVETLTEVPVDRADGELKVTFGAAANLRISADGRTVAAWYSQLQPSGVQLARLDGNTIHGAYAADSAGHVTPGPDGQTVFTEKGMFDTQVRPVMRRETALPAVQGSAFLTLTDAAGGAKRVAVWESGRNAPTATFDTLPGFDGKRDPFELDNPNLALDRRLFLVPDAKVLVVVPPSAKKLHVYKVN